MGLNSHTSGATGTQFSHLGGATGTGARDTGATGMLLLLLGYIINSP